MQTNANAWQHGEAKHSLDTEKNSMKPNAIDSLYHFYCIANSDIGFSVIYENMLDIV
jgi:hypothetical protein